MKNCFFYNDIDYKNIDSKNIDYKNIYNMYWKILMIRKLNI